MPRALSIESHPQKTRIVKALLAGESTHHIAAWAKPTLSAMAVQRYRASIVTPAVERSGQRIANLYRIKAQAPVTIEPEALRLSLQSVQDAPILALRDARVRLLQGLVNRLNVVTDERAEVPVGE